MFVCFFCLFLLDLLVCNSLHSSLNIDGCCVDFKSNLSLRVVNFDRVAAGNYVYYQRTCRLFCYLLLFVFLYKFPLLLSRARGDVFLFCLTESPKPKDVQFTCHVWQRKAAYLHKWEAGLSKCCVLHKWLMQFIIKVVSDEFSVNWQLC